MSNPVPGISSAEWVEAVKVLPNTGIHGIDSVEDCARLMDALKEMASVSATRKRKNIADGMPAPIARYLHEMNVKGLSFHRMEQVLKGHGITLSSRTIRAIVTKYRTEVSEPMPSVAEPPDTRYSNGRNGHKAAKAGATAQ